ncbi:TerD family protein [Rhodococcus sp. NPDC003383]
MSDVATAEARSAGIPENLRWAVVHVETSGRRVTSDRVTHVALLVLDRAGEVEDEFTTSIDPGSDLGPSLTRDQLLDRLAGSPHFEDVANRLIDLLEDRTMVAYDANVGFGFLDAEFKRADVANPIQSRLCIRALSRRLELDVPNLRLDTLASYWKLPAVQSGDAIGMARQVAEIFLRTANFAHSLDLPLPLVDCTVNRSRKPNSARRVPCPWTNPGRFDPEIGLVQGMKIGICGPTRADRADLSQRMTDAGLDVMSTVGRHVGVVVCNDINSCMTELEKVMDEGIGVISEGVLEKLLRNVQPGTPRRPALEPTELSRTTPAASAADRAAEELESVDASADRSTRMPESADENTVQAEETDGRPWMDRHILVVGGTHLDAVEMRSCITRLGAHAAINLSAAVTDVVVLEGGSDDPRMAAIGERQLPVLTPNEIRAGLVDGEASKRDVHAMGDGPRSMVAGEVLDLPRGTSEWAVHSSWRADAGLDGIAVDIVAFAVAADEKVARDEDFVFYNYPARDDGSISLAVDGNCEQSVHIDTSSLPATCSRVVVAAAIDGDGTFGDLGPVSVNVETQSRTQFSFVLDAGTTELTMVLCEIYRRGDKWRIRAVGQGYDDGLADLARRYGVDVAEE